MRTRHSIAPPALRPKPRGEDAYYSASKHKLVQIGRFQGHPSLSLPEFHAWCERLLDGARQFFRERYPPGSLVELPEYPGADQLLDMSRVCCTYRRPEERTLVMALNHGVVGGGDFLELGVCMFRGTSSSLLTAPGYFGSGFCAALRVVWDTAVHLCTAEKRPAHRMLEGAYRTLVWTHTVSPTALSGVPRKVGLVHHIMSVLHEGFASRRELRCWLPIGLVKDEKSPYNNVGIVPFAHRRGSSLEDTRRQVTSHAHWAVGTNWLARALTAMPGGGSYSSLSHSVRRQVDCVLTLANITDAKEASTLAATDGGFLFHTHKSEYRYPVYVWGLTIDGVTHLALQVSSAEFDLERVRASFPETRVVQTPEYQGARLEARST